MYVNYNKYLFMKVIIGNERATLKFEQKQTMGYLTWKASAWTHDSRTKPQASRVYCGSYL